LKTFFSFKVRSNLY